MIRVNRGPCPPGFQPKAQKLIARFHHKRALDPSLTVSSYWNSVRRNLQMEAETLHSAFRGKCAYCESHINHVADPHIEHYRPKVSIDLAFDWDNWLWSCPKCNHSKREKFPMCGPQPCLIDPSQEDPASHVEFVGYTPVGKTARGQTTIETVGLDRNALETKRSHHLDYIGALITLYYEVPAHRVEARQQLIEHIQDYAEYAAMTRCYLRDNVPDLYQNIIQYLQH